MKIIVAFTAAFHSCDYECRELFVRGIGDSNTKYLTERLSADGGRHLAHYLQPPTGVTDWPWQLGLCFHQ